jgi:hypothetical protein
MDIFLDKKQFNEDSPNKNLIAINLYNLATNLYKKELDPSLLLAAIQIESGDNKRFDLLNMEDADEAIIYILQAIYGVNDKFKELTYMKFQNNKICNQCGNTNINMDINDKYILPLENKSEVTLDECFQNFEKPYINYGYLCSNCNICKKHEEFSKLIIVGDVLLIQLKRFEYSPGGRNRESKKIQTKISLPQIINLF